MKKVLTVVLLVAAFCSCKKSTDTTIPSSIEPLTPGNYWRYAFVTGTDSASAKKDTFKLTVLSGDSIIQGHSYKILSDSLKKYNFFYRSVGDTDYRRGLFSTIKGGLIPDIEEPYYLENSPLNTTWKLPISIVYSGIPITATNNYKIVSYTDTITVAGTKYTNVSHVVLTVLLADGKTQIGGGNFYYSKGYGAISYVFSVSYFGVGIYQSETLLSSHIQ